MKKVTLLLFILSLAFAFTACEPNKPEEPDGPGTDQPGTPEEPDKKATLKDWCGEWMITSSHTLTWDIDMNTQTLTKTITENPRSFQVSISESPGKDTLLIAGLSFLGAEWPALAKYDEETGKIGILSSVTMGQADQDGFVATWAGFMVDQNGKFVGYENADFVTYTMTKKGKEATSVRSDRTYDGDVYTVMATEIYGFKPGYNSIRVYTGDEQYPIQHFAGDLTWEKLN